MLYIIFKTLNDLLQSLALVKITDKNRYSQEVAQKDEETNTGAPTEKSIYPLMIKNLTQLKSLIITSSGVKLEGESGDNKIGNIKVGKEYLFTNKKGGNKNGLCKTRKRIKTHGKMQALWKTNVTHDTPPH
jgi:hypothetical protein